MANSILSRTVEIVRARLGRALDDITIERIATGAFFTGVKLSTGHAGACASPVGDVANAALGPVSAAALRGCRATDLLDAVVDEVGIRRTLGIATLNALAQLSNETQAAAGYEVVEGLDAFAAAQVRVEETVVVVGAFVPFLRALRQMGARHWVLEKDPSTLQPCEMPHFLPAERAAEVVPTADLLIITGTTLANDTFGPLIGLAKASARIVVVGPSVTMIPDAFFERGCHILGGIRVREADAFLDILGDGGAGHHVFGKSATKIILRKRDIGGR